jgi:hypothetical protein
VIGKSVVLLRVTVSTIRAQDAIVDIFAVKRVLILCKKKTKKIRTSQDRRFFPSYNKNTSRRPVL